MSAAEDPRERARRLGTEQAQRIVAAARRLVAQRGIERTHVIDIAREAGVARGLVTYYFGTKDRLLAEVMEADHRARMERLQSLADANTLEELLTALSSMLGDFTSEGQCGTHLARQELGTLALRNDEIRNRRARLRVAYREALATVLRDKQAAGVVAQELEPETAAGVLVALWQGLATEVIAAPEWNYTGTVRCAEALVRRLLEP